MIGGGGGEGIISEHHLPVYGMEPYLTVSENGTLVEYG